MPRFKLLVKFQRSGGKRFPVVIIYFSPVCLLSAEDLTGKDVISPAQKHVETLGTFARTPPSAAPRPAAAGLRESPELAAAPATPLPPSQTHALPEKRRPSRRGPCSRLLVRLPLLAAPAGSNTGTVQTVGWRKFS